MPSRLELSLEPGRKISDLDMLLARSVLPLLQNRELLGSCRVSTKKRSSERLVTLLVTPRLALGSASWLPVVLGLPSFLLARLDDLACLGCFSDLPRSSEGSQRFLQTMTITLLTVYYVNSL